MLEQQMLSVRKGAGKVRTTQEIVQELALRAHSPGLTPRTSTEDPADPKSEMMSRFLESQANSHSATVSPA